MFPWSNIWLCIPGWSELHHVPKLAWIDDFPSSVPWIWGSDYILSHWELCSVWGLLFYVCFVVLQCWGFEPRASPMLVKCTSTELQARTSPNYFSLYSFQSGMFPLIIKCLQLMSMPGGVPHSIDFKTSQKTLFSSGRQGSQRPVTIKNIKSV